MTAYAGRETGSMYAADIFNSIRRRVEPAGKFNFDEGISCEKTAHRSRNNPTIQPNPENNAVLGGRESMKKFFLSLGGTLLVLTAHATTVAIFTDNTFNLANYSESMGTTGGATVSFAQCPSCGNPGQALQILETFATTTDAAGIGFVNNTFAYNPSPIPVTSINFSVDKNLSSNIPFDPTTTIGTAFRPLIEQDGLFYIAAVSGPIYHGGTTGYLHVSQSGLVATDFTQYNFTTGTFGTAHPNFAGDTLLFGLAQLTGAAINNENAEIDYDNLRLLINNGPATVPEGGDTAVLLLGSVAALLLVFRIRQRHQQANNSLLARGLGKSATSQRDRARRCKASEARCNGLILASCRQ